MVCRRPSSSTCYDFPNFTRLGIPFVISAGIHTADNDQNGFFIETQKSDPIEFAGVIFHGVANDATGPNFTIFSQRSGKGCSLAGGVTLFGSSNAVEGDLNAKYYFEQTKFVGSLTVKARFIPGTGKAAINFEVAEGSDHKMHFRFVDLPGIFEDALTLKDVIDAIEELTKKDKCGMLTLAFKYVRSQFHDHLFNFL